MRRMTRSTTKRKELRKEDAQKNLKKLVTTVTALRGMKPRPRHPRAFRTNKKGEIVADDKIYRILRHFGYMGHYPDTDYKGWTGMKPIYEMQEKMGQTNYRKIFHFGEDLIFKKYDEINEKKLPSNIKHIDEDGNEIEPNRSTGIKISVENGLRLRKDLMDASRTTEKPLIFVMATHAHVMLKVSYRGNIFSIGYGHTTSDHEHYGRRHNYFANAVETRLSSAMEPDDLHAIQGVLWSTDFLPPGKNHAVKLIWVDYLNNRVAKKLDSYLRKVRHVEMQYQKQIFEDDNDDDLERISNQTELFLDNSVYSTIAGHIQPEFGNAGKPKNCIVWAGEILGRNFNCGLLYAPESCMPIPSGLIEQIHGDLDPTGTYYINFNDENLKKAQDSVKPSILTQIGRHPKAATAATAATIGCLNGVCSGESAAATAATAAAAGVLGAVGLDCCDKGVKALLGNSCDGAVCTAPPPQTQTMVRSGGKTHKRKKKKQNRRKTKKRNRKKTNKHKKRQINIKRLNHKRKFKKKTRKTII
tara:strand:- start:894 stop:2477 length:1584 start_codon:yes stop_codon:yes gene_type:complete